MTALRAIIDIGSNTVRLVVYNGPPRAPVVLLNEKVTPRLGREVAKTGRLCEKAMETALTALARYAALLKLMAVNDVQTVATAAVRDAENGKAFLKAIGKLGLDPRLLSGEDEARASAMGVIAAFPGAHGVAGDLGGGSLELIPIAQGAPESGITLPFGTLRLPALREDGDKRFNRHVAQALDQAGWTHGKDQSLYIVGGSWRALALYAMHRIDWPLDDPHDFELTAQDAAQICSDLSGGTIDEDTPRISSSRMATLPDAAALLGALIAALKPDRIVFSSWGLREGLLYAALDQQTRNRDPVVSGIAAFTDRFNVDESTAQAVCDWIGTVAFTSGDKGGLSTDRLPLCATMLAIAAMRTEPNTRMDQALTWALAKRWVGLDARGRALIAMTVLASIGKPDTPKRLSGLASKDELKRASAFGLAIRLCRKLTNFTPGAIAQSSLALDEERLTLHLKNGAAPLYDSSVEKNLRNLAGWLEKDWTVSGATLSSNPD